MNEMNQTMLRDLNFIDLMNKNFLNTTQVHRRGGSLPPGRRARYEAEVHGVDRRDVLEVEREVGRGDETEEGRGRHGGARRRRSGHG